MHRIGVESPLNFMSECATLCLRRASVFRCYTFNLDDSCLIQIQQLIHFSRGIVLLRQDYRDCRRNTWSNGHNVLAGPHDHYLSKKRRRNNICLNLYKIRRSKKMLGNWTISTLVNIRRTRSPMKEYLWSKINNINTNVQYLTLE